MLLPRLLTLTAAVLCNTGLFWFLARTLKGTQDDGTEPAVLLTAVVAIWEVLIAVPRFWPA